jgi:[ribosomal protein S5]-alanine N-acetyltransferase
VSILSTERLALRELTFEDDAFILALLNEPGFLRYIGDKSVRTLSDARDYIQKGPRDAYARHGYGLYATCLKDGTPIGMCGLVRRAGLDAPDLGFAFLSRYWGKGYAVESAAAVLKQALGPLKIPRVVAITALDNGASIAVLQKVGLKFSSLLRLTEGAEQVRLFTVDAQAAVA